VYRRGGKLRRLTLGRYPAMSLAEALERHHAQRKLLNRGIDPRETKRRTVKRQEETQRRAAKGTIDAIADEYIKRYAKPNKITWREDERMIEKDVLSHWRGRPARDLRRRDVVTLLDTIMDRGAPVAANGTFAVLTRMFGFALERDLLGASPVAGVKRPFEEKPRKRAVSDSEIRSFWRTLPETKIPRPQQLALKLLLATGQRRGELTKAKVGHVNLESGIWTIPPELINKKRGDVSPHEVPLNSVAMELVRELVAITYGSDWILASPKTDGHIDERALTRSLAKNLHHFNVDEPFTPHDFRRTVTTRLAELGVPHHVIQKVLNHEPGDITARVYDRHDYLCEKRQALDQWVQQLKVICEL